MPSARTLAGSVGALSGIGLLALSSVQSRLDGVLNDLVMYRCKKNIALGAIMSKFEYVKTCRRRCRRDREGALKPGDRLPPQRSFAYERKIAVSTASRVYTELLRRGLVVGEVGRGTFISGEVQPRHCRGDRAARRAH